MPDRRVIAIAILALLAPAVLLRSALWPSTPTDNHYLGYVEGETTLIAAVSAGRLVARPVARGDTVAAGAPLFSLDPAATQAQVDRLVAAVSEAEAQLDNITTGKRTLEIEVLRAQRAEAEASLAYAETDLKRASDLVASGTATRARLDQAQSQVRQLKARVEQLKAQEAVGDLPGRDKELEAARQRVTQARANLDEAKVHLADLAPRAPVDATVDDTFYDVGEWVAAGAPVVSLLAPGKVKLRFFVPEPQMAGIAIGTRVRYTIDGTPAADAVVTYVAPRAEFTPPVIYSDAARKKLVFLVEARPLQPGRLRPGMPVEVKAAAAADTPAKAGSPLAAAEGKRQ